MNEKMKNYTLENWGKYNLTDSKQEFIALLNILEAREETLDSLHDVVFNSYNNFCGITGSCWKSDRDVVKTLFDFHQFFTSKEEFDSVMKENAENSDCTLEEFIEGEDIRYTSDGIVRVLYY